MTASKTANLGLMNPVGSDPFLTTDFSQTMGILDQNPGVLVVANQASRPTGWSASQHGRLVWQADQNIMWIWNQPSGGGAGAWLRQGVKGWLGGASNAAQVNTTAITVATAPVVVSTTQMVPGGRPTLILYSWVFTGNSSAKFSTINLIANSVNLYETRHNGNGFDVAYTSNFPYPPQSSVFAFVRSASGTQENVNFQLKLRCQDPAAVGSAQGGGSAFIINTKLDVFEI
jgi:hypothetical protein